MRPCESKHALRFVCAWAGTPAEVRPKLHALLQWLKTLEGLGGEWFYVTPAPVWKRAPCDTPEDIAKALEDGRAPEGLAMARQSFYLGPFHAFVAIVRIETSAEGERPLQALQVIVYPRLDVERARLVLVGLVGFFKPLWAAAGPDRTPPQLLAPEGPASGWLVYLSHELGAPSGVEAPATVTPVGAMGWLLQAHPDRVEPGHDEHRRACAALEKRLLTTTPGA